MALNNARRLFMQKAAGAVAAVPALPGMVQQSVAQATSGALGGWSEMPMPERPRLEWGGLGEAAWKLLSRRRDEFAKEMELRAVQRIGGLDPDIASLNLPPATKARMQLKRDRATREALRDFSNKLYPEG